MNIETFKLGRANLKTSKKLYYALTDICGIGYYNSAQLCTLFKLDKNLKLKFQDPVKLAQLSKYLDAQYYILNNKKYPLYKFVVHSIRSDIKNKINTGSEEGNNHAKGYRVHGQKRK